MTCIELCCPTGVISRPSTAGTFGSTGCEPLTVMASCADSPSGRVSRSSRALIWFGAAQAGAAMTEAAHKPAMR